MVETRRRRAQGEASRERILDAAAQIAGERGYEGTSIKLVSQRSGLPASSIYWYFRDKDELIAAVMDRSFQRWLEAIHAPDLAPDDSTDEQLFHIAMQRTGAAITQFPDYLRLGLMLILERRPEEPTARRKFLDMRHTAADGARRLYTGFFHDLTPDDIDHLVTLTIALADGLFIAQEVDEVELTTAFDLLATAILGTAHQLRTTHPAPADH